MTGKIDISREKNAFNIGSTPDKLKITINNECYSIITGSIYDNDYVLNIDSEYITTIGELAEIIVRYMIACGESKIYYPNEDELIVY